ncbi:MAG: thiol oxidoreductase, partial [Thiothrix sp.]|nr:thiol oxidoreductase [Thiothrix sp.]
PGFPELENQLIQPFTDLLLHDMGPGLADGRPDFEASGQEWRTAPLWGLGLVQTVNPQAGFLHDGRASTLMEAILWHGGEAEAAQRAVLGMDKADRSALLRFLESL